jgi:uncharacterized protein YndB with AHSA1/START domain
MDDLDRPDDPTTDASSDEERVTRQIDVGVDPDELWRTIADDDERAAWWGGDTALDLRPGGEGHATDPDGTVRHIRVDEVEPGHRLSYRWWSTDDDGSSVDLVVVPQPGGSRLTVTETRPTCSVRSLTARADGAMQGRLLDLELLVLCRVAV